MPNIEHLHPIISAAKLDKAIGALDSKTPEPLLTQLPGGILGFRDAAFAGFDNNEVYAQKFLRKPGGRGAYFDVYNNSVDVMHPVIGVYNLTGHAVLRATVLSHTSQAFYDKEYPEPTDEALERRRELSSLAFRATRVTIMEGIIKPATGVLFPQFPGGRHLVHDIVPTQTEVAEVASFAGSFVKLVVPRDEQTVEEDFITRGYLPFDKFIEAQLSSGSLAERIEQTPVT